ncbi:hypothetical protein O181_102421 [Austropuccinia psidii MF-1]|uniref:Chromo domain-containing protein n=1 Tax=Austropuccinia psidii MF-1 TaxID=1389203 RepID=A0A9Q3JIM4_9BASI|nr:hypothetical protein [Austropuccinia psidii MF-1]
MNEPLGAIKGHEVDIMLNAERTYPPLLRRLKGKKTREYLVRYRNPQHEDEWLSESKIPNSQKFLRRFRHESVTDGGTVTYNTRKRSRKFNLDLVAFSAQL